MAVSKTAACEEDSLTFKSDETIWGRVRQADESIQYSGIQRIEESGQVSLELSFVPPHPFIVNLPENHRIEAQSITEAYARLVPAGQSLLRRLF
jgi:hypothetical protein